MKDFKEETEYLKTLIRQVGDTGSAAWIAGQRLSIIRKNQSYTQMIYNTFGKYCKAELNISVSTAYAYIKIYENYDKEDTREILISYLKTIADIVTLPEKRKVVIKVLKHYDKDDFNNELLKCASYDIENAVYKSNEQFERETKRSFTDVKRESSKKKQKEKTNQEFGKNLKSRFIPDIKMEKEPINEMGVVALFCLIFDYFEDYFEIDDNELRFSKIKFVQAPFPDACITCKLKNNRKEKYTELFAEFEFESFEYINHRHHRSIKAKDCKLIICWEDNAKRHHKRKNYPEVINMPPVFELKNFLETGEIRLLK
jgi:hypothetical protein